MIKEGNIITIDVVGKLEDGMVFIDSKEDEPLTFEVGKYDLIKGFNDQVTGLNVGDEKDFDLEAKDAFGVFNDDLLVKIPLDELPSDVQPGMQLKSDEEAGEIIWTIHEILKDDGLAVLDGNHILAGQKLSFHIKVTEVK